MSQTKVEAPFVANNAHFKNLFINGDMKIAQRATSASSVNATGFHACDRWGYKTNGSGLVVTMSQDTDVPTGEGFTTSLKFDVTTADTSTASAERVHFGQTIEAQNLQHLASATSSAKKVTLSFWVKSTITGTYAVAIYKGDQTARLVNATYTVSSANTWEHKVVTFPADTTGAISNGTTYGMQVYWLIVSGSNSQTSALGTTWATYSGGAEGQGGQNLLDSTDNIAYITGVQLEVGQFTSSTLPAFQHESFGDNLARCYRYYQMPVHNKDHQGNNEEYGAFNTGTYSADAYFRAARPLGVEMRANPTLVSSSGTNYFFILSGVNDDINDLTLHNDSNFKTVWVYNNDEASSTAGQAGILMANNLSAYIAFDAEL